MQQFSSLLEVARAFHIGSGGSVTLMLRALFDESGIHEGSKITAFGGGLASEDVWDSIEKDWQCFMEPTGVKKFHATDCNNARGEYRGWTPAQIVEHMRGAVDCMTRKGVMWIGAAIVTEAYEKYLSQEARDRIVDPYYLCMEYCIQQSVIRMLQYWPKGERVAVLFDRQDEYRPRAQKIFNHYMTGRRYGPHVAGIGYINPPADEAVPAFGPPDLMAYEMNRGVEIKFYDPQRWPRKSFDRLWRNSSVDAKFYDRESCEWFEKKFRSAPRADEPLLIPPLG